MKKLFIALTVFVALSSSFAQAPSGVNMGGGRLARPVAITTASASGSVGAGAKQVTFIFGATFAGTVQGATFSSSDTTLYVRAPEGDSLGVINYTISAGSARILVIR